MPWINKTKQATPIINDEGGRAANAMTVLIASGRAANAMTVLTANGRATNAMTVMPSDATEIIYSATTDDMSYIVLVSTQEPSRMNVCETWMHLWEHPKTVGQITQ